MWSVNGINYTVTPAQRSQVLIDTCSDLGFDIPRFCYHENLKIAGNCRMCLIEDAKSPKPVISCAGNVSPDMTIFTNTTQVKKARESVMEFLLINHPLDCPICDQGGECDLQDLSLVYGSDHGRFYDYKRNVEDKNCGPIVKTVMNRCILCTRCVRFATDVANIPVLGLTGRGGKMEIGSYIEQSLDSELSGNLVDVCPVGALTLKPYSFVSRPWELKRFNTYLSLDDQPQLVRVDLKENQVVRIMPSKNSDIVNKWITNRTRLSYEGLSRNRVLTPEVFKTPVTWSTFFILLQNFIASFSQSVLNTTAVFLNSSTAALDYTDLSLLKTFANNSALSIFTSDWVTNVFTFLPVPSTFQNLASESKLLVSTAVNWQLESPINLILLNQLSEKIPAIISWRSTLNLAIPGKFYNLLSDLTSIILFLSGKSWINSIYPHVLSYYFVTTPDTSLTALITSSSRFSPSNLLIISPALLRAKLELNLTSTVSATSILLDISVSNQAPNINCSVSRLDLTTHNIDNSTLLLPTLTAFEKANLYYDTHYNVRKGIKIVSSTQGRSISAISRIFLSLFAATQPTVIPSLPTPSRVTRGGTLLELKSSTLSFHFNSVTNKAFSPSDYYSDSLLQNSHTIMKILNTRPLSNIY